MIALCIAINLITFAMVDSPFGLLNLFVATAIAGFASGEWLSR